MDDSDLSIVSTCPGNHEIDRNEFAPVNKQESLGEKLRAHYRKGMRSPKRVATPSAFPSEFVNRTGILVFLFTVISTLKIGVFDVMPVVHEGQDHIVLFQQCLILFIFLEVIVNWLGIRYVDSSFKHFIDTNGDPNLHKKSIHQQHPTQKKLLRNDFTPASLTSLQKETICDLGALNGNSSEHCSKPLTNSVIDSKLELFEEAARVNKWMESEHKLINSRSIDDLINIDKDQSYSNQDRNTISEVKTDIYKCSSMVPKPVVRVDGRYVTESYPYWSWVPCYVCRHARPPRCHHCPLCKTCVLKRDHHCYFAGACIGYRNFRFFLVFSFWSLIACVYASYYGIYYLSHFIWSQISLFDLLFPIAIVRYLYGYLTFNIVLTLITLTLILIFNLCSVYNLIIHCRLIASGLTSFEKANLPRSLEIKDTRKLSQKIKSVFGRFWLLNFIFPLHHCFKPQEDPVYWPDIQVLKH